MALYVLWHVGLRDGQHVAWGLLSRSGRGYRPVQLFTSYRVFLSFLAPASAYNVHPKYFPCAIPPGCTAAAPFLSYMLFPYHRAASSSCNHYKDGGGTSITRHRPRTRTFDIAIHTIMEQIIMKRRLPVILRNSWAICLMTSD